MTTKVSLKENISLFSQKKNEATLKVFGSGVALFLSDY